MTINSSEEVSEKMLDDSSLNSDFSNANVGNADLSNAAKNTSETREALLVRLFNQHYTSLVRLASFLLDDMSTCEEIVQDAFVKMQVIKQRPEIGKEAAYLRSIVLNGARSKMRRRLVKKKFLAQERPASVPSVESEIINSVERQRIIGLLRTLPKRQSEVLILRFYMDLSEDEIARNLDISKGSVKTHASRGLDKMAELLGTKEFPNSPLVSPLDNSGEDSK